MRRIPTLGMALLLGLQSAEPAMAARGRAVMPAADSLSIVIVDAPSNQGFMSTSGRDAWLDLKSLSRATRGRSDDVTRIRRQFGTRIVTAGAAVWGTVVVTARLESSDGRAVVRLDGRTLTTAPLVVDPHAAIGTVAFHTLEIEVSDSTPEGPLTESIIWEITID